MRVCGRFVFYFSGRETESLFPVKTGPYGTTSDFQPFVFGHAWSPRGWGLVKVSIVASALHRAGAVGVHDSHLISGFLV